MKKDKKNEEIIDSYDYLANAASSMDCTGLMPTPAHTPEEREAYDAIYHMTANFPSSETLREDAQRHEQ
jgi:hypothetical protein